MPASGLGKIQPGMRKKKGTSVMQEVVTVTTAQYTDYPSNAGTPAASAISVHGEYAGRVRA